MICLEVLQLKDTKTYQNFFLRAAGGGSYSDLFCFKHFVFFLIIPSNVGGF